MWKSYFDIQISIATFKIKKRPFTFSKPAPEASPVLTLGISSKGQVRTKPRYAELIYNITFLNFANTEYVSFRYTSMNHLKREKEE